MCPETIGRPMEILVVEDDRVQARLTWEAVNRGEFLALLRQLKQF